MSRYDPLNDQSSSNSLVESHDDLLEDFSSFKCYSPKEIDNLMITFTQTSLEYDLDKDDLVAHFYAISSSYQMNSSDKVGISPMRKSIPFVSKTVAECEAEVNSQVFADEVCDESEIVAKKVIFKLTEVPVELSTEIYFQFCYINVEGSVLGVSTPFKISRGNTLTTSAFNTVSTKLDETTQDFNNIKENYDSIIMEKRDDEDFIVVRSQESFHKERIENLTKSNVMLEYVIRSQEKDLAIKTNELQNMFEELKIEKVYVSDLKKEKEQILADHGILSDKHIELQKSFALLKPVFEEEKKKNELLNFEFNQYKMKNHFTDDEIQKILKDKEEEILVCRDMVANLKQINADLKQKLDASEDKFLQTQSSFASVLAERREKLENYEILYTENCSLKQQISDLEAFKTKQSSEIKTLEEELFTSVNNFNSLEAKFQKEHLSNDTNAQQNALNLEKKKYQLIEMHARLEQSRVEYGNLFRKFRALQKMERPKSKESSRSNSISSVSTINHQSTFNNEDDIDLRLQKLEEDEANQVQPVAQTSIVLVETGQKQPLNKDLEQPFFEVVQEPILATNVKTLASTSDSNGQPNRKAVVEIPCVMCNKVIDCHQHEDGSGQMQEMVEHLEAVHKQKMCPVCSTLFDTRLPIFSTYFSNHVQNHFNNIKYPNLPASN